MVEKPTKPSRVGSIEGMLGARCGPPGVPPLSTASIMVNGWRLTVAHSSWATSRCSPEDFVPRPHQKLAAAAAA